MNHRAGREGSASRFLEGTASVEDRRFLLNECRRDGDFLDELVDCMEIERLLRFEGACLGADVVAAKVLELYDTVRMQHDGIASVIAEGKLILSRPSIRRVQRRKAVVSNRVRWIIAACLALVVGAIAGLAFRAGMRPERVGAPRIAELCTGTVVVNRGGGAVSVWKGMRILEKDVVRVGAEGGARVRYDHENTTVDLLSNTEAEFREENKAKRITLSKGTIKCDVARQGADRQMVVTTPHAIARVVGTRFRLSVEPGMTMLVVMGMEGLVKLRRRSDGKETEVPAGRYVVAGRGRGELKTGSAGDEDIEYADGEVLFREDFEGGMSDVLSLWRVVEADAQGFVRSPDRDTVAACRTVQVLDGNGTASMGLAVDAREIPRGKQLGLQLQLVPAERIAREAGLSYVCEYDVLWLGGSGIAQDALTKVKVPTQAGEWVKRRYETICIKKGVYRVRAFIGGLPTRDGTAAEPARPGVWLPGGRNNVCVVDNYVIRRLVKRNP